MNRWLLLGTLALQGGLLNHRQNLQFIMFTAVSTYLVYTMVPAPSPSVWLALLLVVVLFSAMQSAFRAFHEPDSLWAYLNQLASPAELLWMKSIRVVTHTAATASAALMLFCLFFGLPPSAESLNALLKIAASILLGSMALASTMSFTSALASRAGANPTLMATLSIPLLLPTVLVAQRASSLALANQDWVELALPLFGELAMLGLPLALGSLLMPYLWKQ